MSAIQGRPSFAARIEAAWLRRGALAMALLPLSALFGLLSGIRRALYASGFLRIERLSVPVLIVGNLIAGGAGKTPSVLACVKILKSLGYTPGIVSRGYRPARHAPVRSTGIAPDAAVNVAANRAADEATVIDVTPSSSAANVGDEPLLLRLRGGVPVVVGADRVAAGRHLLERHPDVDIVVSDDGLQHLHLARDASVIVFDERGAGNGWLLPAGPLRERLPEKVPRRTVVLYNASTPSTPLPGHAARPTLAGALSLPDWWLGHETPRLATLLDLASADASRRLVAMAGVARPERFFGMLASLGLRFERLPLSDHYAFATHPAAIDTHPWPAGTTDLLVTEKDAVKLRPDDVGGVRVWVVALDFDPEPAFAEALAALLPKRPGRSETGSVTGSATGSAAPFSRG